MSQKSRPPPRSRVVETSFSSTSPDTTPIYLNGLQTKQYHITVLVLAQPRFLPLRSGKAFQQVTMPSLQYCPKLTSRKNNGKPAKTNMMVYGMRKAPVMIWTEYKLFRLMFCPISMGSMMCENTTIIIILRNNWTKPKFLCTRSNIPLMLLSYHNYYEWHDTQLWTLYHHISGFVFFNSRLAKEGAVSTAIQFLFRYSTTLFFPHELLFDSCGVSSAVIWMQKYHPFPCSWM